MAMSYYEFRRAIQATENEAGAVLGVCDYYMSEAMDLFPLYPRELWAALPSWIIAALAPLPLDVRKQVLDDLLEFFPGDVFAESMQGLNGEDRDYLAFIALRVFANTNKDVNLREQFAQTLQLGKTVMLPLFQEWAKELREMEKAAKDSLEWEAARKRLKLLLNHTAPNLAEKFNAVFRGMAENVANLRVRFSDKKAQTALHIAASFGDMDLVNNLLAYKARLNAKDKDSNTVLHASVDHPGIVEALLRAAEKLYKLEQYVQQVNFEGETALHWCENAESARLLLRASPSLLFAKDKSGRTPLHLTTDNPGVIEVLLDAAGKEPGQLTRLMELVDKNGKTALHCCKNAESARLLLRAYPNLVFAKDDLGHTPLHLTTEYPDVVEVFLEAIKDRKQLEQYVQQVNTLGRTALHCCQNEKSARLLLRACPSVLFAKSSSGDTPLHSTTEYPGVVEVFLEAIKDPEQLEQFVRQVDKSGETALHHCYHAASARLLLRASPSLLFFKDNSGSTPLHLTTEYPDVVEVLLTAIQDSWQLKRYVQQVDNQGETALYYCRNGDSTRLLLRPCPSD